MGVGDDFWGWILKQLLYQLLNQSPGSVGVSFEELDCFVVLLSSFIFCLLRHFAL